MEKEVVTEDINAKILKKLNRINSGITIIVFILLIWFIFWAIGAITSFLSGV